MKNDLRGKRVLILGLGQYPQGSGVAAAVFAAEAGAEVRVTDLKTEHELQANVDRLRSYKNVSFFLGGHRAEDVEWAEVIIRNPRVRPSSPEMKMAIARGVRIESDISLFLEACPCPVVGITGTRGKSTTSTLVYEMLCASGSRKVWLGGNILISPLTFLKEVKTKDIVVLELSSWMLEVTGMRGISPHIAAVTNVMRDHLNTYESLEAYAEAKAQIFRHQGPKDLVVLHDDDDWGRAWTKEVPGKMLRVGSRSSCDGVVTAKALRWRDPKTGEPGVVIDRAELALRGEHNAKNVITAALIARAAGATLAGIRHVAHTFTGLPDRQEIIAVLEGVTYVNDTTATTPDATLAAIHAFAGSAQTIHLIAGGADKELDFTELARALKEKKVCVTLFPGSAYELFSAALRKARVSFQDVASMVDAVAHHHAHAQSGDVVLLSPGCASFGIFTNEFDRGAQFRVAVEALK